MSAGAKWILIIVGLLVGNVAAMVILMLAASTSSAGVIPNYYDKAAHYDDAIDQANANRALGWHVAVSLDGTAVGVRVTDANGASLDGASVRVSGYPRAHAAHGIDVALVARSAGTYEAKLASRALGWHDLVVEVTRGGERFVERTSVVAP
jgi:nitrogen fixation protein FixH